MVVIHSLGLGRIRDVLLEEQAMIWFCNPNFKGQGIIPLPFERLDDLVLARNEDALRRILEAALVASPEYSGLAGTGLPSQLGTAEELADWCWRVLKERAKSGKEGEKEVLALIERCATVT